MSKPSVLSIPDHAVLRWLERVEGINAEDVRNRIRLAASLGLPDADGYIHLGKCCLAIEGGVVKTVLGPGQKVANSHRTRLYRQRQAEASQ